MRLSVAGASVVLGAGALALVSTTVADQVERPLALAAALVIPGAMIVALAGPANLGLAVALVLPVSLALDLAVVAGGIYTGQWGTRVSLQIVLGVSVVAATVTGVWLAFGGEDQPAKAEDVEDREQAVPDAPETDVEQPSPEMQGPGGGRRRRPRRFLPSRRRELAELEKQLGVTQAHLTVRESALEEAEGTHRLRMEEIERRLVDVDDAEARIGQEAMTIQRERFALDSKTEALERERKELVAREAKLDEREKHVDAAELRLAEEREAVARDDQAVERLRASLRAILASEIERLEAHQSVLAAAEQRLADPERQLEVGERTAPLRISEFASLALGRLRETALAQLGESQDAPGAVERSRESGRRRTRKGEGTQRALPAPEPEADAERAPSSTGDAEPNPRQT